MDEVVFSITANLDLLGFSNHLSLGSSDIRTKIGSEALIRLKILDDAIKLANDEITKYPDIYLHKIENIRFNDAIFFVMDLRTDIIPSVGSIQLSGGGSISDYKKAMGKNLKGEDRVKGFYEYYAIEGFKVAMFLGLISRIHNFINLKEKERNFPGCKTVLSTGFRKKYTSESGKEDYFSANFSLSNAYLANKNGSQKGISGNGFYVEDNVSRVIRYDEDCSSILFLSKYLNISEHRDPYEDSIYIYNEYFSLGSKIEIELFQKKYYFRQLNTNVLSNFRLIPILRKHKDDTPDKSFIKEMSKWIKERPKEEEIERKKVSEIKMKFPLLFICIELDEDIEKIEREMLKE